MVEIIWTNQALLDLEGIGDYIAKDSPVYASITVDKLFHKPNLLKGNPRIGRIIPEKNDEDIREQIEGNYRIIHIFFKSIQCMKGCKDSFPPKTLVSYCRCKYACMSRIV